MIKCDACKEKCMVLVLCLFSFVCIRAESYKFKNDFVFSYLIDNDFVIVKGQVLDQNGDVLEGVDVLYKERARLIKTDSQGAFVIAVRKNESLEFSCPGFKTKTIKPSKKDLKIVLKKAKKICSFF